MKRNKGVRFISTTVIGGLLFLVPLGFLGFVLFKIFGFMMIIAEPMAGWIPVDTIGGVALANLIAIGALILLSFLAGLLARNALASTAVKNLESKVLMKIPGYTLIRGIKGGFDSDETSRFRPVALSLGSAERLGFEIQKLADGRSMVFLPSVPNALAGITEILPPDQVTYLDVSFTQIVDFVERYGHGADELLARKIIGNQAPAKSADE